MPILIYCAGGNSRFAQIAMAAGYQYGARLPNTVYGPLYFADQDWHEPNRAAYMAALQHHTPCMATVLDWERDEQLGEVLGWAEEASQYVRERVLIVPKAFGGIHKLPRSIGGKEVVLAYSVPTRYGGTQVPIWEFAGWPIHLLGGSPHAQLQAYLHLSSVAEVVSADGNYHQRMAVRHCQFFTGAPSHAFAHRWWPTILEADGQKWSGDDAPYEAFRRSCQNIMEFWRRICGCASVGNGID